MALPYPTILLQSTRSTLHRFFSLIQSLLILPICYSLQVKKDPLPNPIRFKITHKELILFPCCNQTVDMIENSLPP